MRVEGALRPPGQPVQVAGLVDAAGRPVVVRTAGPRARWLRPATVVGVTPPTPSPTATSTPRLRRDAGAAGSLADGVRPGLLERLWRTGHQRARTRLRHQVGRGLLAAAIGPGDPGGAGALVEQVGRSTSDGPSPWAWWVWAVLESAEDWSSRHDRAAAGELTQQLRDLLSPTLCTPAGVVVLAEVQVVLDRARPGRAPARSVSLLPDRGAVDQVDALDRCWRSARSCWGQAGAARVLALLEEDTVVATTVARRRGVVDWPLVSVAGLPHATGDGRVLAAAPAGLARASRLCVAELGERLAVDRAGVLLDTVAALWPGVSPPYTTQQALQETTALARAVQARR